MSRNINAEKAEEYESSSSKGSAKKNKGPFGQLSPDLVKKVANQAGAVSPPRPPLFDKETKEIVKKVEKNLEQKEGAELYRKIVGYLKNPHLNKHLQDFEPPRETASLDALRKQYAAMQSTFKESAKRVIVMEGFANLLNFAEMGAVAFLDRHEKVGCAKALLQHPEVFQPELEEIIVELSDDWIPDAKIRLALKALQFVAAYDNHRAGISNIPVPSDGLSGTAQGLAQWAEKRPGGPPPPIFSEPIITPPPHTPIKSNKKGSAQKGL